MKTFLAGKARKTSPVSGARPKARANSPLVRRHAYVPFALLVFLLMTCLSAQSFGQIFAQPGHARESAWREALQTILPSFGHRNWIVVADSAYPDQSREGLRTVVSQEDQIDVLKSVLAAIGNAKHVSPSFYTDLELKYLDDKDVPGITAYKQSLEKLLGASPVSSLPHDQIISKLDQVAQTFRVLLIKTNMIMPYTSVFIQLDCKYWTPEQELALRRKIAAAGGAAAH